jgi:hypothetical protein
MDICDCHLDHISVHLERPSGKTLCEFQLPLQCFFTVAQTVGSTEKRLKSDLKIKWSKSNKKLG